MQFVYIFHVLDKQVLMEMMIAKDKISEVGYRLSCPSL